MRAARRRGRDVYKRQVQLVLTVKVLGKLRFGLGKALGKALVRMGKREAFSVAEQRMEKRCV